MCVRTVQNAVAEAIRQRHLCREERERKGRKNLTNILCIVSREWLAWIERGPIGRKVCTTTKSTDSKKERRSRFTEVRARSPHPSSRRTQRRPPTAVRTWEVSDAILLTVSPSLDSEGRRAYSGRGQFFDGVINGRLIVTRSSQPLLDGARALLAEGIDPRTRIVTRHAGTDIDALKSTVGAAAKLSVTDATRDGKPRFVKWQPNRFRGEQSVCGEPPIRPIDPADPAPYPRKRAMPPMRLAAALAT